MAECGTLAAERRALELRLAALEGTSKLPRRGRAPAEPDAALRLRATLGTRADARYAKRGRTGAVGYAGAVKIGERLYRWAREQPLPDLLGLVAQARRGVYTFVARAVVPLLVLLAAGRDLAGLPAAGGPTRTSAGQ